MAIDWSTLALQAVNFLVLVWLLRRYLYRPVLAMIDRRRGEAEAARAKADEAQRRASAAEDEWRRRRDGLADERQGVLRDARVEAAGKADEIVAAARRRADGVLAEARAQVDRERHEAAASLHGHAAGVATALAGRLLDSVAPAVGAAPFLEIAARRLDGRAVLRVETWPPLAADECERWRGRLGVGAAFAEAPELIAGARLVLQSAVLEASWAESLARAGAEMAEGESDGEAG